MRQFAAFACIDWSGAVGECMPSIAVAVTNGAVDVDLQQRERGWSRRAVLDWLRSLADSGADMLIGVDLSPGFPFVDQAGYFPGWDQSPLDAPALWSLVEHICADDPHFAASSFVDHSEARRHFRHSSGSGDMFPGGAGRMRACELGQGAMGLRPSSCFNLVGAAQVGKSSLTGMRVFHHLGGAIPFWPFDPLPDRGPCLVEIYTSLAARAAGVPAGRSKMRDAAALNAALSALDAKARVPEPLSDHASDALVTAAWLRTSAGQANLWHPDRMTDDIRRTEGWTFGIV